MPVGSSGGGVLAVFANVIIELYGPLMVGDSGVQVWCWSLLDISSKRAYHWWFGCSSAIFFAGW